VVVDDVEHLEDGLVAGSTGAQHLNAAVVGLAPTPDGHGCWEVAADGGIFGYGDAGFYGSLGGAYAAPRLARNGPLDLPSPWSCIAQHESGGDPSTNTGNGLLRPLPILDCFMAGGRGSPGLPSNCTAAQQLQIAQNLQARQGSGAWPVSSRLCGV